MKWALNTAGVTAFYSCLAGAYHPHHIHMFVFWNIPWFEITILFRFTWFLFAGKNFKFWNSFSFPSYWRRQKCKTRNKFDNNVTAATKLKRAANTAKEKQRPPQKPQLRLKIISVFPSVVFYFIFMFVVCFFFTTKWERRQKLFNSTKESMKS